ncbi:MAG TPA: PDZ domain-containing protein [Vicinamibacterales bacterium]|nr:PDZ domain-containing protein [Vicinamibacterales bacterium]
MSGPPIRLVRPIRVAIAVLVLGACAHALGASRDAAPIVYTLSFPAAEQRWMQVEIAFPEVTGRLTLRMSRSSPGRYALHEFAKNVYDVVGVDAAGRTAPVRQVAPNGWEAEGNGDTLRVRYKVFGDRLDGTYLAIDQTHAHLNAPAALMWAEGRELDPVAIRIQPPAGSGWRVATQLFPTSDPYEFRAPNLHYLMDSPIEASAHARHTFTADLPPSSNATAPPTIVVALHHRGGGADRFIDGLRLVVREQAAIYGEYPPYENGTYTFLADFLPWAIGDGMEHRNSTVLTSTQNLAAARTDLLALASHEFFHGWNVERIRPRTLEPFNLLDFNVAGELWLAEGFTTYYETLTMVRAGLIDVEEALQKFGAHISAVLTSTAHRYRSADEMSRLAVLWDGAEHKDRTNLRHTFLSYYTHGAALGMGFDLAIRERTQGQRSLDDFMRAMWIAHGRTPPAVPGLVATPYTLDDVRRRLAEVVGDDRFASELVDRFVLGREVMDYAQLVELAGLRLRHTDAGRASLGEVVLEDAGGGGVRLAAPPPADSPAAAAGLGQDDVMLALGGNRIRYAADLTRMLARHRPGDVVVLRVRRRSDAQPVDVRVTLEERRGYELVAMESEGAAVGAEPLAFRNAWLGSRFR